MLADRQARQSPLQRRIFAEHGEFVRSNCYEIANRLLDNRQSFLGRSKPGKLSLPCFLQRPARNAIGDIISCMASLVIRKLDDRIKSRLRVRAAHHGRSMEEEAREILRSALSQAEAPQENIAEAIRRRFAPFGGVELPVIERA